MMKQTTQKQREDMFYSPSDNLTAICHICDQVAAVDRELKQLRYKIDQVDDVITILKSSWKMDAAAIRSTQRNNSMTARLDRIEALQADINDLTKARDKLINEAMNLYKRPFQFLCKVKIDTRKSKTYQRLRHYSRLFIIILIHWLFRQPPFQFIYHIFQAGLQNKSQAGNESVPSPVCGLSTSL